MWSSRMTLLKKKKYRMLLKKNSTAVVLLAHGSSDPNWKNPFIELAKETLREGDLRKVSLAFFELEKPSLEDIVAKLHTEGEKNIFIFPVLLANGYHLKIDLPKRLKLLNKKYPRLEFATGSALIEQLKVRKSISEQIKQVTFS